MQPSTVSLNIDILKNKSKSYQRKRISLDEEKKTREWLRSINFHSYISDEDLDLMDDPFRNGILLCELLCFLENIQIFSVNYKPKTIKDCRENIDKAVAVCFQIGLIKDSIPSCLLSNKELILKGDHATVWGILNCLRTLYPDVLPREHLAYLENTLPYTSQELIALEASLLNWIHG